jgi:uncharacterized heparinase superfamily protein
MDALLLARGAAAAVLRRGQAEWFGGIVYRSLLGIGTPQGLAAHPHSPRPADSERGRELLQGVFQFGGSTMRVGANGDPFDRPSPSRAFALGLHRFDWLPDLLSLGEQGVRPGVRLYMDWRRLFGRWNAFSWSGEVLERRVLNLACAARPLTTHTSEAEAAFLTGDLARQARHLLAISDDPSRAVERAVAAGVAGCVLAGRPGEALIRRSLKRLAGKLPTAVLGDGGHATRSPQRGLELLLDLLTLDDALLQRGVPAPEEMSRAIDRLSVAVRFFTLADGRLAAMQGGEAAEASLIAAALAHEEARKAPLFLGATGYHKLQGPGIEVIADTGSASVCAQPLSIEVICGRDRLITSGEGRLTADGSGAELGDRPLARLTKVTARRHETEAAMWLEASHDGWLKNLGLTHDRRLFIDRATGELRGEDRFEPPKPRDDGARLYIPFVVRFHLGAEVKASLAQDGKTVILRGPSNEGRWLRTDAAQVAIEPSPGRSGVIVLRGQVLAHKGGRVRWKLSASES